MVKIYDTILVTRNARDKIQLAQYILEQQGNTYTIKRFTGQFGGKITAQPELTIGIGKAKRTVLQQAQLEYDSLVKKALDKGYKKFSTLTKIKWDEITPEELDNIVPSLKTDNNGNIKPQLAKSSNDCAISIFERPMFCSRKIDGVRCLMRWDGTQIRTISRGGNDYDEATTLIRRDPQLIELFKNNPELVLDGELYVHGWSLQKISGTCRKKTWDDRCEHLQYWIYDIADCTKTFNNRLDTLIDLKIDFDRSNNSKVVILEHELLEGWSKIKKEHDKYVSEGFEGLVARKPDRVYAPGRRSSDWVKLKDYMDMEFKIVGISKKLRPEDMCFVCITEKGATFEAKPVGSREVKYEYLENPDEYIGKMATIKFFIWSDEGIPLQPVLKCIREEGE